MLIYALLALDLFGLVVCAAFIVPILTAPDYTLLPRRKS